MDFGAPFRSAFKMKLALDIILEHFGDITHDVAKVIVNSESPTLSQISRQLASLPPTRKLSLAQIRQAMLVLLQHNMLEVELPPAADVEGDAPSVAADRLKQKGLVYGLNLDMVLNRLRFSKVLTLANSRFGEVGVVILEEVIAHGRLKPSQIRAKAIGRLVLQPTPPADATEVPTVMSEAEAESAVCGIFEQLIRSRLIVSVSPMDFKRRLKERKERVNQILASSSSVSDSSKAAAASVSAKPEAPARSAVADLRRKRKRQEDIDLTDVSSPNFGLPAELRFDLQTEDGDISHPEIKRAPAAAGRGAGRGRGRGRGPGRGSSHEASSSRPEPFDGDKTGFSRDGMSSASSYALDGPREDVLWTIGWEHYIREQRHAACVQYATDRMEALAGTVVKIMLDLSMPVEVSALETNSRPVSLNQIHEILKYTKSVANVSDGAAKADWSHVDIATLRKLLEFMRLDATALVTKVARSEADAGGPSYYVNMNSIISTLQRKTVQSIAVERFGPASGRIIELLMKKKYLDQQVISDMIIVPAKETRERLYRLFKDKWVDCNEISKRPDFNPAATTYLWKLDRIQAAHAILNHIYQSMFNIRLRRKFQYDQGKHIMQINRLNEEETSQFDLLSRSLDRLDNMVLLLDTTLMVLLSFSDRGQ